MTKNRSVSSEIFVSNCGQDAINNFTKLIFHVTYTHIVRSNARKELLYCVQQKFYEAGKKLAEKFINLITRLIGYTSGKRTSYSRIDILLTGKNRLSKFFSWVIHSIIHDSGDTYNVAITAAG